MSETFNYENLIAGSQKDLVNRGGTVALGQSFARGQLVGLLTASGKWQICDFDAVTDYEDFGIAAEAVDTTEGSVASTFYVEGEFSEDAVTISYGDDADDWRSTLADHGIYLRATVTV